MDNAQIVTEVRSRIGQTSLSDQTITSLITPLVPKEGEPTEEFFNTTANWIRTLGGNYSHDVATQVTAQVDAKANEKFEAFKRDYKPEAPKDIEGLLKILGVEEKPAENGPKSIDDLLKVIKGEQQQQQNSGVSMEDVLKAIKASQQPDPKIAELTKKIDDMMAENARLKNETDFKALVNAVTDKADELNVSDTALWNHSIEVVSGSVEKNGLTAEKLLELTKAKFEELTKALRPSGTKPYGDSQYTNGSSFLQKHLAEKQKAIDAKKAAAAELAKRWK